MPAGIFDGIVENIGYSRAKLARVALHNHMRAVGRAFPLQTAGLQVMPRAREFDAFTDQAPEIDFGSLVLASLVADLARLQHLLYGSEQAVRIVEHQSVELLPLGLVHFAPLQGFKVEADRRDRRLQFVRHGVDEAVVALVAPDFAHQENRVEDQAGDDGEEENQAEEKQDALAPVKDDPAARKRHGGDYQADAQDQEERDRLSTARNSHHRTLRRLYSGWREKDSGDAVAIARAPPRESVKEGTEFA